MSETHPPLPPLLDSFEASPIARMFSLAADLKAAGKKILDLSSGEPDADTPAHIKAAAAEAMARGETKYLPVQGSIALREAVRRKFARDNGLELAPGQIVIGSGAKPLLADLLRSLAAPGDEVVLASPCWPSHTGMIRLVGATPRLVPADPLHGAWPSAEDWAAAITHRTRVVLLCSPSNPSGAVFAREDLEALAEVLRRHPDAWIVSDDLYEHLLFDGRRFVSLLDVAPDLTARTILVNGVSKAYAMTGWRIGFAAGPLPAMAALGQVLSQATGCPSSISDAAAIAALDGPQDCLESFRAIYQRRRDRIAPALDALPGLACPRPAGAFYLFPSCAGLIGRRLPDGKTIESSQDFLTYLLEDFSIAAVPGSAFSCEPHFRLSIASADEVLDAAVARIGEAISSLKD